MSNRKKIKRPWPPVAPLPAPIAGVGPDSAGDVVWVPHDPRRNPGAPVLASGQGPLDVVCARCGHVVARQLERGQVTGFRVQCGGCGREVDIS